MGGGSSGIPQSFDINASQKEADLMQSQWQDYLTRFQPVAQQMVTELGPGLNTKFGQQNVQSAKDLTTNAFDSGLGSQYRDLSRYGQGLSSGQSQQIAAQNRIAGSAATAGNANLANLNDIDMRNQAAMGGLGSVTAAMNPNARA